MTIYRVNMSKGQVMKDALAKEDRIEGGRGLIALFMDRFHSPEAHPLSEESLFVVATGPLAGTGAPMAGRLSVGGKSPLTGGIKEANSGGIAGHKLGRLGIRGIVVEGRAKAWRLLKVDRHGAFLEDAQDIAGLPNYEACERLRQRYGEKVAVVLIGPAGEKRFANSTVGVTDTEGRPCRHAARGGVGAIMGAKGLKAIVIDDKGAASPEPAHKKAFKEAVKAAAEAIKAGPFTEAMHAMGTPLLIDPVNGIGNLPTHNHRLGSFDKSANINAEKMMALNAERGGSMGHGCMPGCVVRCSPIFHDTAGNYLTAALEFETLGMLGSNLGIDDLDTIARLDRRCDELGLDTIELGNTLGILNDVGLFSFGDGEKAEALVEEIAEGSPLGLILGSGTETAAKVFGIDRIPAVKGQGIPAHMARSAKGYGVTYATSPQGADHTAGGVEEEYLSSEGHAERSRNAQIAAAALDSAGMCMFTFLFDPGPIVAMINAFYGVTWTGGDYMNMGMTVLKRERAFNKKAGIGPDRLPLWMRKEALPPTNAQFDVPQEDIEKVFDF